MLTLNQTPEQLQSDLETLYNQNENAYGAGYADALAHAGGLVTGIYSEDVIAEQQERLLNPTSEDFIQSYRDGYVAMWNRLVILTNAALVKTDGYGVE